MTPAANAVVATVEAALCVASITCVVAGVRAIRRRELAAHRRCMLVAFGLQATFLALFLARLAVFGLTPCAATGAAYWAVYGVLVAHEAISVPTIPLVIAALVLGLGGRRFEHREVARMAKTAWLVSMTSGVLVYVLVHLVPW